MSAPMVIDGTKLTTSSYVYSKPRINAAGGKAVSILNTATKKGLHITTPLMMTWGVNENDFEGSGKKTYDMSLQFPRQQDANYNEEVSAFLKNMTTYENAIKSDARKNAKDWFGKNSMSAEVIDALFTPMLRYPKDKESGEYDKTRTPSLRVKLPYWESKFNLEIYNVERELVFPTMEADVMPIDLIQKGQNVALVIQSGGVWFANGKFGTTWKLVQAVVQPKVSILGNKTCMVSLSQSDRNMLATEKNNTEDETNVAAVVESSEDEEAEAEAEAAEVAAEVAPEPIPEPVAPKKKKVVRKRKTVVTASD